jgi:oligoribonuclease NrnB/cAMP/cGMP phosphodiesterase (DHH superfamily)
MKKRLVIYHANCIDGFTAAWVAWLKFGDVATEYVAANYGDTAPTVEGRDVLVVDFSYPRDVMLGMREVASSLLVLDHHKTAQASLEGLPFAKFDMARSGAGIAWDELHGGERPWLVDYVEDRDLWRWKLSGSKPINAWISACKRDDFAMWGALYGDGAPRALARGEAVLTFIDRYVSEMVEQARLVRFEGHEVPIVNAPYINISELVGKLAESAPFALGWFHRADGLYAYSLRSRGADGVDVSEIAKKYGGGGHQNSAGFTVAERLPL